MYKATINKNGNVILLAEFKSIYEARTKIINWDIGNTAMIRQGNSGEVFYYMQRTTKGWVGRNENAIRRIK